MTECYFCESTDDIETHHILPQRFNGSDAESNLVDLCHDCHWKLERLYNKEFWEAIGVDDPRATREGHVVCEYHQCMEHATNRVPTPTGIAHYCDEHKNLSKYAPVETDADQQDKPKLKSLQKYED